MVSLFSAPTLEALLYLLKHSPQVAQVASVQGRRAAAPCRAGRFRGGAGPPQLQCRDFAGTPVCLCPDPWATLLLGDLDKLLPSSTLWFSAAMMQPLSSRPFLPFRGLLPPLGLQHQQLLSGPRRKPCSPQKPLYFPSWICASLTMRRLNWGCQLHSPALQILELTAKTLPSSKASSVSHCFHGLGPSNFYFHPVRDVLAMFIPISLLCSALTHTYLGGTLAPLHPLGPSPAYSGKPSLTPIPL